jgi:hypothetical protein
MRDWPVSMIRKSVKVAKVVLSVKRRIFSAYPEEQEARLDARQDACKIHVGTCYCRLIPTRETIGRLVYRVM